MCALLSLFKVDTFHLQNPWFQVVKPWVLGCETLGFTTWNQCFQSVISWVSETAPMHPQKMNIYAVLGGRGAETTVLLWFASLTIVEQGLRALFSSKKWGYSLPSPAGRGWGWGCIFGCWRTGHGDHRPTLRVYLFYLFNLCSFNNHR